MIKRFSAVFIIICLLLTGCMMEKQDYSGLIAGNASYQALVPVNSTGTVQKTENDINEYNSGTSNVSVSKSENIGSISENSDSIDENTIGTSETTDDSSESIDGNSGAAGNNAENAETSSETVDSSNENTGNIDNNSEQSENSDSNDVNPNNSNDSKPASSVKNETDSGKKEKEEKTSSDDERFKVDKENDKAVDLSKINLINDDFDLLAPATTMEFAELVGDNGIYGYPEGFPEPGTYRIVVDLYHQLVMAFTRDENGEYTIPVRYMLCSSGADSSQSPTGTFKMRNYRVRYALFNNTTSYAQYWSLITGRIYFHSILYSSKDASTYTESYKRLGTNVSHGCIRLTVPDARWIWYNCAPETVVEIRKGSKSDKQLAKLREKMILASYPSERLKLKKGKIPMTDNWTIDEVPHDVSFVNGSQ